MSTSGVLPVLLLTMTTATATRSQEPILGYDTIFSTEGRALGPERLRWTESGDTLGFLHRDDDGRSFWVLGPGDSEPKRLLRAGELHEKDKKISLAKYQWSPDGTSLLLLSDGDLFLYRIANAALERLTDSADADENPKFSPDGRMVSFVRKSNLWLLDLESLQEKQLTQDGKDDQLLFGKTDWVYWEEIWGRSSAGTWWSPDSRRIALYRFDETGVGRFPLLDSIELDPKVTRQPYPRAGEKNPTVNVGILDLDQQESMQATWMKTDLSEDSYLCRVNWSPDGSRLLIHRLNRAQTRLDLLSCSHSGKCRVLIRERSESWIDLEDDFRFLEDGRIIWGSDRDGWRRLYLYSGDGELQRPLTPEGLSVTGLFGLSEDQSAIFYGAFRIEPLGAKDRQIYKLDIESGTNDTLSDTVGWHSALISSNGARVHTSSTANSGRRVVVHTSTGSTVEIEVDSGSFDRSALPQWQFLSIDGPNGSRLPARMLTPARIESGHQVPAIMYHYGGPASQVVVNNTSSRPTRDLWHQRMAQRGYVVLQVDNEASRFFGKEGAQRLHLRFGEIELQAQLAGVEFLQSLDYVDGERIGLWGWSGGGSNTLYSILKSPNTWRAAVAGAPVTDWRLYDSIWTERYLGRPGENEVGFRESSAVTWATQLKDPLLLVHGTADDNVHPNNTLVLSQKLIEAGIPFEQALYPGQKHAFDKTHSRHFYERMEEFFDRHLR